MPNFSGIWTVTQQMQAKGASTWPATPGAPTIGTATAGTALCASVTFTAPGCTGAYPAGITGYRVISTPGCFTQTGASSPLVVTGLTAATSYTFKAQATNGNGYGALSAASNSITATLVTCATYTTAGSYSWVAPTGVTSVAVVAVGGGGGGNANWSTGGGGGLGYKNGYSVTPGSSYTVVVGAAGPAAGSGGGCSYFVSTAVVKGGKGGGSSSSTSTAGTFTGDGGGNGGSGSTGGGGAGGYSGNGGTSSAGAGGGGGAGGRFCTGSNYENAGGGGVGLFGQGANGAAGVVCGSPQSATYGKGGSGGSDSTQTGGAYGGGGGYSDVTNANYPGGRGAVRIVWAGGARGTPSFPSTNVGP